MKLPSLPARAAYLTLNNARRRNALSLAVLRDLREQLYKYNTSPNDGKLKILPTFQAKFLDHLEALADGTAPPQASEYSWLVDHQAWSRHRGDLPKVIVLKSDGPVFSAGHDLGELRTLSHDEVKETFAICAEVMGLIRRSPAPVISVVQGLATAAGCQLALTCDLPVAVRSTQFRLPGASLGLPCTSPSTAVSRRLGNAFTARMLVTADAIPADQLGGGSVEVVDDSEALEHRVTELATQLAEKTAGQPQALGKWAFWTQASIRGAGGDGYEEAAQWAGRMMALHARSADAREGMESFFAKRAPVWKT